MNNNKYVGLWFRDYQQGHGVMYYYNGDIYDGEWRQDKRNGKGNIPIVAALIMMENGKMTRRAVKAFSIGQTVRLMMVCGLRI